MNSSFLWASALEELLEGRSPGKIAARKGRQPGLFVTSWFLLNAK
jgi:hypothetical protein